MLHNVRKKFNKTMKLRFKNILMEITYKTKNEINGKTDMILDCFFFSSFSFDASVHRSAKRE